MTEPLARQRNRELTLRVEMLMRESRQQKLLVDRLRDALEKIIDGVEVLTEDGTGTERLPLSAEGMQQVARQALGDAFGRPYVTEGRRGR